MILVDTHVIVWLAFEQQRLSTLARSTIDRERQNGAGLAISDITLLELASLSAKGRFQLQTGIESFLREVEMRFIIRPITSSACVHALALPSSFPKDPADRIIAGTALSEGLALLTADQQIRRSRALATIW